LTLCIDEPGRQLRRQSISTGGSSFERPSECTGLCRRQVGGGRSCVRVLHQGYREGRHTGGHDYI